MPRSPLPVAVCAPADRCDRKQIVRCGPPACSRTASRESHPSPRTAPRPAETRASPEYPDNSNGSARKSTDPSSRAAPESLLPPRSPARRPLPTSSARRALPPTPSAGCSSVHRQPRDLHPRSLLFPPQFSFQIKPPRLAAPQFPARSFRNGLRRQQLDHIRRHAHRLIHGPRNLTFDPFRRGHIAQLGCYQQPFSARTFIRRAKRHYASRPHSRHASRNFFHLVRIKIAPRLDDYVFRAPCNVNLAFAPIRPIARIDPVAIAQQFARRVGITVISPRSRRTAKPQPSFLPLTQIDAVRIHNPHFHRRHRLPRVYKFQCRRLRARNLHRSPLRFKLRALNSVHFVSRAQPRH